MDRLVELKVNGKPRAVSAEPDRNLLGVLRDELELTGAKYGCGEGRCGACTVLVEGEPVRSCTAKLSALGGKAVTTIEGIEFPDGRLHPIQEAFLSHDALQCGYCTPGMIMSALALLQKAPNPDRAKIIEAMRGNVCRCGTYSRILAAIRDAAKSMRGGDR